MKKIGIVGGVAWQSTVEYYRMLCGWTNAHFAELELEGPPRTPPIMLESLVMRETRALRAPPGAGEDAWAAFDDVIRQALLRLQAGGCDFAILANNTFHNRLPSIRRGVDMEIVSILDAVASAAAATGARRALVLGTRVTMWSDSYAKALAARGVEAIPVDDEAEIDAMQAVIDHEFHGPTATAAGKAALIAACERHAAASEKTAVLLACTELPLAFPDHLEDPVFEADGWLFVNTTAAHARAALNRALQD